MNISLDNITIDLFNSLFDSCENIRNTEDRKLIDNFRVVPAHVTEVFIKVYHAYSVYQ